MKKINKNTQLNLRLTEDQKEEIKIASLSKGYKNVSEYIIDSIFTNSKKVVNNKIVYSISLDPSLDYFVDVGSEPKFNERNQIKNEKINIHPGGRGINLSMHLKEFGFTPVTWHHSSGFVGQEITSHFDSLDIANYRVRSQFPTKINMNINFNDENNLFIHESPQPISSNAQEKFYEKASNYITKKDYVILSGSMDESNLEFIRDFSSKLKSMSKLLILNLSQDGIQKVIVNSKPDCSILDWTNISNMKPTKKNIIELIKRVQSYGSKEVIYIADSNYIFYTNGEEVYLTNTSVNEETKIGLTDAVALGYVQGYGGDAISKLKWISASAKSLSTNKQILLFNETLKTFKEDSDIEKLE